MKRFVVLSLLVALLMPSSVAFANTNTTKEVVAPKWEDYVPNKYQEPRMFSRGKSLGELGAGIGLSTTIILSPVGVPMIVHSTTKLKNIGYYNKKIKFDDGLAAAEEIKNPVERQKYYDNLVKECNFNPKFKVKHDREAIKQAKKADKNSL